MSLKMIILLLSLSLLSACAAMDGHQQATTGYQADPDSSVGTDLYNANKNVQKPQASGWGWLSNQN